MSQRRKYPNNKAGRKQRRLAEAPATERTAAQLFVETGEHAMALCEAAEDRLMRNLPRMNDRDLQKRMLLVRDVLDALESECVRRDTLRELEDERGRREEHKHREERKRAKVPPAAASPQ